MDNTKMMIIVFLFLNEKQRYYTVPNFKKTMAEIRTNIPSKLIHDSSFYWHGKLIKQKNLMEPNLCS